ncbi:MAG TPA: radical SAM protein [Bryobacteraceae bacterium]|nr:radical SAM protein [Bryobacteraceae bacterium]
MQPEAKVDALLVGWEKQENLGLRYVMAYLRTHGLHVELAPFSPSRPESVTEAARRLRPALIGFSIIFQYNLREFAEIMRRLRRDGITAHFTAGGHYPSLCPGETLGELESLDSVVRFEGEETALELLRKLNRPAEWGSIRGLAYRDGVGVVVNPPRPLIADLDSLPWPVRGESPQTCRGMPAAPMLASRGCLHDCTFCSIRQFYGEAPGSLRRTRSPREVTAEMRSLYLGQGVRVFLFQDDDFAARTLHQRRWVRQFLADLDASGLTGRIGWKISCRVDDVEEDLMRECRRRGLLAVYLGVESGTPEGLQTLGKRVTVDQNLRALRTLKRAGLDYDMGFMLFDPDSTFATLRANLDFLRQVAEIEGPPISFVKMLPLAGTAIHRRLAAQNRLTGDPLRPDYNFLDRRVDYFYLFVILNFSRRNSDPEGLVEKLRQAYFDSVLVRAFGLDPRGERYQAALRGLIDRANLSALDTLEAALNLFERCPDTAEAAMRWHEAQPLAGMEHHAEEQILAELDGVLEEFNPALEIAFRTSVTAAV